MCNGIKQIDLLNRPRTLAHFKWFLKRQCQQCFLLLKKYDSIAVFVSIESFQKWPGLSKTPPTENTKDILFNVHTNTKYTGIQDPSALSGAVSFKAPRY